MKRSTSQTLTWGLVLHLIFNLSQIEAKASLFSFDRPAKVQQNCPPGQIPVDKPEGTICMKDFSHLWKVENVPQQPRRGFNFPYELILPTSSESLPPEELTCFAREKIFWPPDNRCYSLLEQGPCLSSEWLVASQIKPVTYSPYSRQSQVKISCMAKPCPCSDPDLCEVLWKGPKRHCRDCIVALAAEQDGLCQKGEQLYNSPFGFGICGCRLTRPHLHVTWPLDGKCYPLHEQGPCHINHTLHWDPRSNQAICVPSLCPMGRVLSILDGKCHLLGTQGPCSNPEDVYQIDPVSKQAQCVPRETRKIKRIFDVLPSNMRQNEGGEMGFGANMLNCLTGGNKCSSGSGGVGGRGRMSTIADPRMGKRVNNGLQTLDEDREMANAYINWILSFAE